MCGVKKILDYSVPAPIVAPPPVEDDSLLPKRHLDLAISDVQSEQGFPPLERGGSDLSSTWS